MAAPGLQLSRPSSNFGPDDFDVSTVNDSRRRNYRRHAFVTRAEGKLGARHAARGRRSHERRLADQNDGIDEKRRGKYG